MGQMPAGFVANPVKPSGFVPDGFEPDFAASNEKDASGGAVVSGPVSRFVSNAVEKSPLNIPAIFQLAKDISHNPEPVLKAFLQGQGEQFRKAWDALKTNRPFDAVTHTIYGLVPGIGPGLDAASEQVRSGDVAGGIGSMVGIGSNLAVPELVARVPRPLQIGPRWRNPNVAEAEAVTAGQAAGVPVDVATATGNRFVRGVQKLADESLGGSVVAQKAQQATQAAMGKYGEALANTARETSVTAEQAGQAIRDALKAKMEAHSQFANVSYDKLRALEEAPTNRMTVAGKPAPVDTLSQSLHGQMRRIVHELDASGYTPGKQILTGEGITADNTLGNTAYVHRTGGAKVFDDVKGFMSEGANPTRGVMQNQLEAYLSGGPETPVVKAALEVAKERSIGKGGNTVSIPEFGPEAMDVPTRLEAPAGRWREMGIPVEMKGVKQALQPIYDQMKRQMPVTQQQASSGLKAMENILQGDDWAPLSVADRDLSAIKSIARKQGGLAKMAVAKFEAAVQAAVKNAEPDVARTLAQGRGATQAKYATESIIDVLPGGKLEEPIAVFKAATAPKDAGIEFLRAVKDQVPQSLPQIARAKLEELMAMGPDKSFGEWSKLGTQTKSILFPQKGQAQALDRFFLLSKRLAENPNPSGTASLLWKGGELSLLWNAPNVGVPYSLGMTALSKLLHSPTATQALTRSLTLSLNRATPAAQAAAVASVVKAAREAGVVIPFPKAAETQPGESRR